LENEAVRVHGTVGCLGIRYLVQIEMIMVARMYFRLKDLGMLKRLSIRETLAQLGRTYMVWRNHKWLPSITTKKKMAFLNELGILI
jgi:hypothetical protein